MKKIVSGLNILFICCIFCNAQVTLKTPTNVSIISWDFDEASSYWLNLWETEAATWISEHSSDAIRIGPASHTYNCHCYAWHSSDGGTTNWINKDEDNNANVELYFSGANPTYTSTDLEYATKIFYPVGDHSQIKCTTPGYTDKYVSKWGNWPLYRHSLQSHPYIVTNMGCYKLNISGDNFACLSQQKTYSTLNISNATYDWDSNNFSISGSTYSVSATANNNAPGSVDVSITSPYSGTTITGKILTWVGVPILDVTGPSEGYTYNTYTFYADPTGPFSGATNYSWVLNPLYNNNVYNYGDYADIAFYDPYDGYQVLARAQNSCGTGDYWVWNIWIYDGGEKFSLSPNPANESVNITVQYADSKSSLEKNRNYEIHIIDFFGKVHLSTLRSGNSFNIPVANLKNGNYIVQIKNGEISSNLQLIVKH